MKISVMFSIVVSSFVILCFSTSQVNAADAFSMVKNDRSNFIQIQLSQQGVFQYKQTLNLKPPFYDGSMPLVFVSAKKAIGQSEMIIIFQDFGKFKNTFTYNDVALKYSGVADGARTTDPSGALLADAKLVKLIKGEGIHIEERHYGPDGKVTFRCISLIHFRDGFKKEEMNVEGKKQKDYYFLWPVNAF